MANQDIGLIELSADDAAQDHFSPFAVVQPAIAACINAIDDASYIRAVRRLYNSITPSAKRKQKELYEVKKPEIEKMINDIPGDYKDYPESWKRYVLAEFTYDTIMEAIYKTMPKEPEGLV